MEDARKRLDAEKREVEGVASQVSPLKERVAGLLADVRQLEELNGSLKATATLDAEALAKEKSATASWISKIASKEDRILEQDTQLLALQQALVDKYEDIREQVFSAEQMSRYHKFEAARLENMLVFRGRVEDIGIQTVMPGDDAETQVRTRPPSRSQRSLSLVVLGVHVLVSRCSWAERCCSVGLRRSTSRSCRGWSSSRRRSRRSRRRRRTRRTSWRTLCGRSTRGPSRPRPLGTAARPQGWACLLRLRFAPALLPR